jgi:ATP-dependent RNA helicase DDX47/RRP3
MQEQTDQPVEREELFDEDVSFRDVGVCDELVQVCEKLNYKHPTIIQRKSLPYSLKNRDIIGLAETGSGKTLAFALPIVQELLKNPQPYFALVIAPTRELCVQISEHFQAIGQNFGLKTTVIVGGLDLMAQSIALVNKKPHVIIATPGRILHHLENTKGFSLENLKYLVMDEADKLLNMDFEAQLDKILVGLPKNRTTLLFSATMTSKVSKLQRASLNNPVKVEASNKNDTARNLVQNYIFMPQKYKDCYLVHLINEFAGKTVLIFVITCKQALRTCLVLRNLGFDVCTIHGQMSQAKRLGSLNKFKSKETKILVATDVASRGLDIPNVDVVINYDIPQSYKDYIHRVGRTARAGKSGLSVSMTTQYDVEDYQKIEFHLNKKLEAYPVSKDDIMIFYERVQEAQRIAEHELKQLLSKDEQDEDEKPGSKRKPGNNHSQDKKKKPRPGKKPILDI